MRKVASSFEVWRKQSALSVRTESWELLHHLKDLSKFGGVYSVVCKTKREERKKKSSDPRHGSEDSQVRAREASSSHGGWSLPDTFFATLLDWAVRLRLNCPPLRRAWSGHVLSLGIIRTYQLQCSPLVACHLHQAGYRRTDLRPPWRWERCDDTEKGGGERGEADREWVRQRHMKEAGTL